MKIICIKVVRYYDLINILLYKAQMKINLFKLMKVSSFIVATFIMISMAKSAILETVSWLNDLLGSRKIILIFKEVRQNFSIWLACEKNY